MEPKQFRIASRQRKLSTRTGLKKQPAHGILYLGCHIIVLDVHQRCAFNFAVVLPEGYREFRLLRQAKLAIREAK
jgi:hypothetical protein